MIGGPISAAVIWGQKKEVEVAKEKADENARIALENEQHARQAKDLADRNARAASVQEKNAIDALKSMTFVVQGKMAGKAHLIELREELAEDRAKRLGTAGTQPKQCCRPKTLVEPEFIPVWAKSICNSANQRRPRRNFSSAWPFLRHLKSRGRSLTDSKTGRKSINSWETPAGPKETTPKRDFTIRRHSNFAANGSPKTQASRIRICWRFRSENWDRWPRCRAICLPPRRLWTRPFG